MTTAGWVVLLGWLILLTAIVAATLYLSIRFDQLQQQGGTIVAKVQIEQDTLDTFAAQLEAACTALAAEIESLKTALPDADVSGLQQALADLQALEAPTP